MPCWYYDKKDLQNTPSFKDGILPETEARYRRDGARFIIDAGAKMGLRYDTCATGVVYFHRFYMFHSFSEFPRCVTAACCLFLAGKVEETPKKCKDLIKITKSMLSEVQFATFKEDPKEEIMTVERILLQTIKFDLMVEHPYAYLLKFAKLIKGDKAKVQKLVQMSWTFINDSLCTTLSLQWEPEVIAVALMYLASRLNKFEINDWQNKPLGFKGKWYEYFVEDITLDLLEDICHQVLDLYSKPSQKQGASPVKQQSHSNETPPSNPPPSLSNNNKKTPSNHTGSAVIEVDLKNNVPPATQASSAKQQPQQVAVSQCQNWQTSLPLVSHSQQFSQTNPYVATGMYSSSFLSQEGSQSIQSLVDNQEGSNQYSKVVAHPQSFQQQSGQVYQSSAIQYVYQQQPLQTLQPGTSAVVQTVAQLQGFPNNAGNDGSFTFQNQCLQVKPQTIYQEASPSTVIGNMQPNVHQWR